MKNKKYLKINSDRRDRNPRRTSTPRRCRPTGELGHDLLHGPSSGVRVAVGAVRGDQVVRQINSCFDTNCTGFLQAEQNKKHRNVIAVLLHLIFRNQDLQNTKRPIKKYIIALQNRLLFFTLHVI